MLMYFKIARLDIKYPVVSEKFYAKKFFSNLPQKKMNWWKFISAKSNLAKEHVST